jgi:hypothetical protein
MKKWLTDKFRETLNQTFTLLGMFIAWAVLDGSAKTVVGWAVLICTVACLFSMKFREGEQNDKE